MNAPGTGRVVLVIGRRSARSRRVSPVDIEGANTLVILAIGWPLTFEQSRIVDDARDVAREARVIFDAILVASPREAATHVQPDDAVLIDAARSETRRIRRALPERRVSALGAR